MTSTCWRFGGKVSRSLSEREVPMDLMRHCHQLTVGYFPFAFTLASYVSGHTEHLLLLVYVSQLNSTQLSLPCISFVVAETLTSSYFLTRCPEMKLPAYDLIPHVSKHKNQLLQIITKSYNLEPNNIIWCYLLTTLECCIDVQSWVVRKTFERNILMFHELS